MLALTGLDKARLHERAVGQFLWRGARGGEDGAEMAELSLDGVVAPGALASLSGEGGLLPLHTCPAAQKRFG